MPNPFGPWLSPQEKRANNAGPIPLPPCRSEYREPLFRLVRKGESLYFINESPVVLESLRASTRGFCTADDDVVPLPERCLAYEMVQPDEAVLVGRFSQVSDSDYVLQIVISVECEAMGSVQLASETGKGGIDSQVLAWKEA